MRITASKFLHHAVLLLAGALYLAAFLATLNLIYIRFMGTALGFHDLCVYTNTLWNTAHGRLFLYFMDQNYLQTHLSFTLALIAPLFHVWDSPLLLPMLQVAAVFGGSLILWRIAGRLRFPAPLTMTLMLLMVAYPYTQSSLLNGFHGVILYYTLVPFLYYCLAFHKNLAWLPVVLILGLREDGFLVAIPMTLYFAVKDRWKGGYILAAIALAYGVLALTVLFPWINHETLVARRGRELRILDSLTGIRWRGCKARGLALFWLFLPALGLFRRRWVPLLVFPSLALLEMMGSGRGASIRLMSHYSAFVFPSLVVGMVESIRQNRLAAPEAERPTHLLLALYWIAATLALHLYWGFSPPRHMDRHRLSAEVFNHPTPAQRAIVQAADHVPRQGALLTEKKLMPFVANRAELLADSDDETNSPPTVAFFALPAPDARGDHRAIQLLSSANFGVIYAQYGYVVLQRGADPGRNDAILQTITNRNRQASSFPAN